MRVADAYELEAGVQPDDAAAGAVRSVAAVGDGVAHVCFFAGVYGTSESCLIFRDGGMHLGARDFVDQLWGKDFVTLSGAAIQHHLTEVAKVLGGRKHAKLGRRIFLAKAGYVHDVFYEMSLFKVVHGGNACHFGAVGEGGVSRISSGSKTRCCMKIS